MGIRTRIHSDDMEFWVYFTIDAVAFNELFHVASPVMNSVERSYAFDIND